MHLPLLEKSIEQKKNDSVPHRFNEKRKAIETGASQPVSKNNGVTMKMEQLSLGVGGRHRMTRSYGGGSDLTESPRNALVRNIMDVRSIYKKDGLYTSEIRESLQ